MNRRSNRLAAVLGSVRVVPAPEFMAASSPPCWLSTLRPSNSYGHRRTRRPTDLPPTGTGGTHEWVHRLAYVDAYGPIPEGYHVDHLCFRGACINPAHLRAVPQAVNARRRRPRQIETLPGLGGCQPSPAADTARKRDGAGTD